MIARRARPDGWDLRLAAEIDAARARAWRWGVHDCGTFCGRVARAMLGAPTAWDGLTGRHGTAWGAARIIKRGGGLLAIMDAHGPRVPVRMARRGDVAAVPIAADGSHDAGGRAVALGVVAGAVIFCAAAPAGLRAFPLDAAVAAWAID
jgi:hypothetical protein